MIFDLKGKETARNIEPRAGDGLELTGDDAATSVHMDNFLDGIRTGAKLRAPIEDGATTVLLCHLGNIAQSTGRALRTDPANGHIIGDAEATAVVADVQAGWGFEARTGLGSRVSGQWEPLRT